MFLYYNVLTESSFFYRPRIGEHMKQVLLRFLFWITYTTGEDGKMRLHFGETRRVINFTRTCVTTRFFELQSVTKVKVVFTKVNNAYLVVEAWAMMFPPMGFFSFPA